MNICTERITQWLDSRPKIKEWLWFILLWFGGLATVLMFAYPIKWVIKAM